MATEPYRIKHLGSGADLLFRFVLFTSLSLLVGCCENLKPDNLSLRSRERLIRATASRLPLCRSNGLDSVTKNPDISIPSDGVHLAAKCEAVAKTNTEMPVVDFLREHHGCAEPTDMVGLGCRLRGGAKSQRTKCNHQGCKGTYMPLAGDCPYCSNRYCMSHRLPEVCTVYLLDIVGI